MEEPKGPRPDLKRRPPLPALAGPYRSPSRRPQVCQGSAARAPRHQLPPIAASPPPLFGGRPDRTDSYLVSNNQILNYRMITNL